jgi:hypothetical protein
MVYHQVYNNLQDIQLHCVIMKPFTFRTFSWNNIILHRNRRLRFFIRIISVPSGKITFPFSFVPSLYLSHRLLHILLYLDTLVHTPQLIHSSVIIIAILFFINYLELKKNKSVTLTLRLCLSTY